MLFVADSQFAGMAHHRLKGKKKPRMSETKKHVKKKESKGKLRKKRLISDQKKGHVAEQENRGETRSASGNGGQTKKQTEDGHNEATHRSVPGGRIDPLGWRGKLQFCLRSLQASQDWRWCLCDCARQRSDRTTEVRRFQNAP